VLFARDVTVKSSRLTVAFRIILAIPQLVVLYALGIAFQFLGFIGWFAALFTGRLPEGMHDFMASVAGYQTRVGGYLGLLTDRYPPFALDPPDYSIEYATTHERLNRIAVFFRIILAVPALFMLYVLALGWLVITVVTWFIVLILGRMPATLFDASAGLLRYFTRVNSYFWLLTPAYPAGLFQDPPTDYGTEPDAAQPQPPRQTSGVKRLIVAVLVLGLCALGGIITAAALQAADQQRKLNELRKAHNAVVLVDQAEPDCNRESDPLRCFHKEAQDEAAAFRAFDANVNLINFGGAAGADQDLLIATTRSLVRSWDAIGRARTLAEVRNLAQATDLLSLQHDWNEEYQRVDNDVAGTT
jgi:hypothetical protein